MPARSTSWSKARTMQLGSMFVVPVWRPQTRRAARAILKLRSAPVLSKYYILGSRGTHLFGAPAFPVALNDLSNDRYALDCILSIGYPPSRVACRAIARDERGRLPSSRPEREAPPFGRLRSGRRISTECVALASPGGSIMDGPGRPSLYEPEFTEQAFELCLAGATNQDLATLSRWGTARSTTGCRNALSSPSR